MPIFQSQNKRFNFYWIGLFWIISLSLHAEIVTDGSVGAAQNLLGPNFSIPETLGSRSGNNLFHSFQRFNINNGEQAIFTGAAQVSGNTDVIMSVRVNQFHAITQKARDVVGGRHNVQFDYVLLDAVTGQPVSEVNSINLKFKALGGRKALVAEMRGDTQKVRITRHVAAAVYEQLKESNAL